MGFDLTSLHPDALGTAAREAIEHVHDGGWDSPPALFALVPSVILRDHVDTGAEWIDDLDDDGGLTLVEQDDLPLSNPTGRGESEQAELEYVLATTTWPDEVAGCAVVQEITVLPPSAASDLDTAFVSSRPDRADEAAREFAAEHPEAHHARLVAAALRDGRSIALVHLRVDGDDTPGADLELLQSHDLAKPLISALLATLHDE